MIRKALSARAIALAAVALALVTSQADGQVFRRHEHDRRFFIGGGVLIAVPQGEFDNYVDTHPGAGAYVLYNFDRHGNFGLRLDGSWVIYGRETVVRPLSETIQRVWVDVTTENEIYSLLVGPQATLWTGAVRPFVNGGIGFSYFATTSSVSGTRDFEEFAGTTNFDDFTFAWSSGGGLWVGVSRSVSLSFSANYVHNGQVRYLREGSIREANDGSIFFRPIESETNLLVFQIGVSIGVGPGGGGHHEILW